MRVKKRKKRSSCTSKITASLSVASKAALANNVCTPDQAGSAAAPLSVHRGRLAFLPGEKEPTRPSAAAAAAAAAIAAISLSSKEAACTRRRAVGRGPGTAPCGRPSGCRGHACSRTVAHARGAPPAAGRSPSSRNAYNAQHNKVCFFAVNTLYNIVYLTS